jgi:hypothetical protein
MMVTGITEGRTVLRKIVNMALLGIVEDLGEHLVIQAGYPTRFPDPPFGTTYITAEFRDS